MTSRGPFSVGGAMGLVVPKVRTHLCADALLRAVQDVFCQLPEHRKGDAEIPLRDALLSAFALFSLTSPSLLACDKERTEANLQRVYGMGRVPCDTSDARETRSRQARTPETRLQGGFSPPSTWQSPRRDGLCRGALPLSPRWHELFFLQRDALRLVPGKTPPPWYHHLFPSDGGGRAHPPRYARSHSPHA